MPHFKLEFSPWRWKLQRSMPLPRPAEEMSFAHVTNQLGRVEGDFEKGAADGAKESLHVVSLAAERWCAAETPIGTGI